MSSMIWPIPQTIFIVSKEIYDFLIIVKENQFKVRKEEITLIYSLLQESCESIDTEFIRRVEKVKWDVLSIHTKYGYISNLSNYTGDYDVYYVLNDLQDLYLSRICKNFIDIEIKMKEIFKKDLVDLGFTGDLDVIKVG